MGFLKNMHNTPARDKINVPSARLTIFIIIVILVLAAFLPFLVCREVEKRATPVEAILPKGQNAHGQYIFEVWAVRLDEWMVIQRYGRVVSCAVKNTTYYGRPVTYLVVTEGYENGQEGKEAGAKQVP